MMAMHYYHTRPEAPASHTAEQLPDRCFQVFLVALIYNTFASHPLQPRRHHSPNVLFSHRAVSLGRSLRLLSATSNDSLSVVCTTCFTEQPPNRASEPPRRRRRPIAESSKSHLPYLIKYNGNNPSAVVTGASRCKAPGYHERRLV